MRGRSCLHRAGRLENLPDLRLQVWKLNPWNINFVVDDIGNRLEWIEELAHLCQEALNVEQKLFDILPLVRVKDFVQLFKGID